MERKKTGRLEKRRYTINSKKGKRIVGFAVMGMYGGRRGRKKVLVGQNKGKRVHNRSCNVQNIKDVL